MACDLRIDVIVATYNRSGLLRAALDSFLRARVPSDLEIGVVVVDNNSTDDTREVSRAYGSKYPGRITYIFEASQGKSYALNAGIARTSGHLVGFVDDDEQVAQHWFEVVREWFSRSDVDFIGGPYKPNWEVEPPKWVPSDYPGVIGNIDGGQDVRTFGLDYPGMLMGGNAVVRRSALNRVGAYSSRLPRTMDEDMYRRLLAAGARGKYVPDLVIYHFIPASRLTKSYYRNWCFRNGLMRSIQARDPREPVTHLFGVPRYLYGKALRDSGRAIRNAGVGKLGPSEAFSAELAWWSLAGYLYGRHLHSRK